MQDKNAVEEKNKMDSECGLRASNPPDPTEMFQKIISAPDAFFRHQQKSEPDLAESEKLKILSQLYPSQPQLFLSRYHKFLSSEDLPMFQFLDRKPDYEIEFYLQEIAKNTKTNAKTAKNRRYVALQKLISDKDFFSDWEMRIREPLLYEQMIGQFQTSEESRQCLHAEDGAHAGQSFSAILMDFCETKTVMDEKDRQQEAEDADGNFDGNFSQQDFQQDCDGVKMTLKELRAMKLQKRKKRLSQRDSDDDEEEMDSSSDEEEAEPVRKVRSISAEEKEKLREEFLSLMHERFLSGADADFFDYSSVDNNPQYDSMDLINRDAEDEYFDSEEPS